MKSITVYCSSSSAVPPVYQQAAAELGRAIAGLGWALVYGGTCVGCMKTLAEACRGAGGLVVGITPRLMVEKGIADDRCDELVVTDTMRERKALMEQRGDAFVTLPGGIGTLEEIFEIIVGKQLKYHAKPIVILNIAGYFDPLLAMIDHGVEHRFIKPSVRDLYHVAASVDDAMRYLQDYKPPQLPDKWFTPPPAAAIE
jgi:uncharacterized protein (TIGR00730 family)